MNKKIIFILIFFIGIRFLSFATHVVGGSLTYVYNGGSNYTITLKLYRDCGAGTASFPGSVNIVVLGSNGIPFNPSKDITMNLGTVTNVPSSLSPCAIPPSPLPCVQEGIYTRTVNTLPPSGSGYHLYYQIVARNFSLINISTPGSTGESFYTRIPGSNETTLWDENFTLSNNTTIDNGPTAWTNLQGATAPNSAMVNSNVFEVKGANNASNRWSSQIINISACNSVGITVNLSELGTLEASDSILVYYKLNGGPLTLFTNNGFRADDFTSVLSSVSGLVGTSLQVIVRTKFDANSPNSEIYNIDNVIVNCSSGSFIPNSNSVFNLFPPLFLCVNQPFTFDHSATDLNGDSLIYSLYTPYNGDNGIGPLDPTFSGNTALFTPVNFLPGFSTNSPIGSPLTLNPSTGLLSGTPPIIGQFVVGVIVKEFRAGVYIGQTLRDFQFNVLNCPAPVPAITVTNISINNGCSKPLVASGILPLSATWKSIFPGAQGTYNNFLSCVSGCLTPTVNAIGVPPPFIDYVVCGTSISCAGTFVCDTVRVTFNTSLAVNILPSNPTLCFGQTSTTLTAIGSGGTPAYSYLWNGINTSQSIFVGVGTYNVKLSDISGCPPVFASIVVTSYSVIINANAGTDKIICKQNPLATINSTITGAVGGIWSSGTGTFSPSNTTLSSLNYIPSAAELALGSATLILTTTGNGSCPGDSDTLVIRYSNFTSVASTTITNISCFGGTNGTAQVNLTGGTGPFSYLWTSFPTQTLSTASNLALGIYSLTVVDGIGCSFQTTVSITQPNPLMVSLTASNVSCNGGINGSIITNVVGGTVPYTYLWLNNGQTGAGLSGMAAGMYTVVVTDSKGCTITNTTTITQPVLLSTILTVTNVSCFNGTNGIINSSVSGGTTVYTYSWSPTSSTGINLGGIGFGTYTLTVTDSKGCVLSRTTAVTQPIALSATPSVTNETCNYLNNGIASVSTSGGTAGYTYLWAPSSQTTSVINGLSSGSYSVTVADSRGCTTTTLAIVNQPLPLSVVLNSQINVSCFGGNNGFVNTSGLGGTPNYTYSWSPGGSTNALLSGAIAGTYTVFATDNNSCLTQTTITIIQPSSLTISSTATNVSCNGGIDGSIITNVVGGTGPYTYLWLNNGQTGAGLSGMAAGIYTVVVTDSKGCTITNTTTITQPVLLSTILTVTNVSCFNGTNGIINSSVSGGTAGYTYSWSPTSSTGINLSGIGFGTYTLSVTDSKGCVLSRTTTVTNPIVLSAISSATNETCDYLNNGIASVSGLGGTAGYTYLWSLGSQTTSVINGLSSGSYSVTVTDSKGCTTTTLAIVNQPLPLSVVLNSQINVSCFGGSNGSINSSGLGGTPNYTYSWSPGGSTNALLSGAIAGTYTVFATDNNSCLTQTTITITQPSSLTVSSGVTNVTCAGGNNGIITISPFGGTAPYINTLYPGGIISSGFLSLLPGNYTVVTIDALGCLNNSNVSINSPINLSSVISQTNSNCNIQNGKASISITSGGLPPFTYQWLPAGGTAPVSTNLFAGTYSVILTDANGCVTNNIVNINDVEGPSAAILSTQNVTCFGGSNGSATASLTGGAGPIYTYTWSPFGGNSLIASGLTTGIYVIKVSDNAGCLGFATTSLIAQPLPITSILSSTAVSCFGGNNGIVNVVASGGTPAYTYTWLPSGSNSSNVAGLISGSYTLQISDSFSCTQISAIAVIQPSLALSLSVSSNSVSCFGGANGTATVIANGGAMPYSYLWSFGGISGNILSNMSVGNYSVTSTDNNGCLSTNTVNVIGPLALSLTMNGINSNCSLANAQASVNVTGGVGSYSYNWLPVGGVGAISSGLLSGNYSVTVIDGNNCSTTNNIMILNNPAPTISGISTSNVSCFGGSNGTATVSVTGGTGPFTYSWSPAGGTSQIATTLPIGTYSVQVFSLNGCAVQATSSIITQPLPIIPVITTSNVSCISDANGGASVTVFGGTPAYTYTWLPSGSNGSNVAGLSSGTYTLQIADSFSCTQAPSFIITQPTALSVNISSITNVTCFGGSNGSASVTASGGTPIYSYLWLPSGGSSSVLAGLTIGSYTVRVTDFNGCNINTTITISQPSVALTGSISSTGISCFGGSNGSASVMASGGTPIYTYSWSPFGGNLSAANALVSGNYFLTIADANNCQSIMSVFINQPTPITGSLIIDNASCGLSNGSLFSNINGGVGPFTYSWNSGLFNAANITGIQAGTYSLVLADANSCISTFSANVQNLPTPSIGIVSSNSISCFGANNGVATATISNAVTPFNVIWLPYGGTSLTATGLIAGTYTMQLTDAKGCIVTANTTINQPTLLSINSISVTNVKCFGENNGSLNVIASGGVLPYTYLWIPTVSSTSIATALSAGSYSVVLKDINNCSVSMSALVSQPSLLTSTISNILNPICNNTTGSSIVFVSGGSAPYTFSWSTSPVQTGSNASGLLAGNYAVNINDINGCLTTKTLVIVAPSQIITSVGQNDTICVGQNATLTATASGGVGGYFFAWNPSAAINTGTFITSPIANTIYTVVAFDANGCMGAESAIKVVVYDLSSANVDVFGQTPICPGQASMISPQIIGNVGPVTLLWNNGLGNSAGPIVVQPTVPTTYVLSVSSSCGITVLDSITILFNPPPTILISADTFKLCAPGAIQFFDNSISGNPNDPITSWSWNFNDGSFSSQSNPIHIFNNSGTYTVNLTVATDGGCTSNTSGLSSIIIYAYPSPVASFSLSSTDLDLPYDILRCTNQSVGATSYYWSFGDGFQSSLTNPSHLYETVNNFQIQLICVNDYGCKDTAVADVITRADVVFPNAFTPDSPNGGSYDINSLTNDVFFPFTSGVVDFKLQIFDRWGELIFESTDVKIGWDGYYRGKICQLGVYIWKAHVKLNNGKVFNKTGDLTLLR